MNEIATNEDHDIAVAVGVLRNGGIVAHACEGVWGLACNPWSECTLSRIMSIKDRDEAKGLIVIGHDSEVFDAEIQDLDSSIQDMVRTSWPGHTTWVIPSMRFPRMVTGNRSTIAARVPGHGQARELCKRFGSPLVSTSANTSDQPPAKTLSQVHESVGALVDFVLPGEIGCAEGPSTIRDALSGQRLR